MSIHKIEKFKEQKDIDGNIIKIKKSLEDYNKETSNGSKTFYFYSRYYINGKCKQYRSRNFKLKSEAKEEERLFNLDPLNYIQAHKKNFKFISNEKKDYTIDDLWNLYCKDSKIKESTLYSYESNYNCHIKQYFITLQKSAATINKGDIKNWMSYIDSLPYSLSYKQKNFTILKNIFNYAVAEDLTENSIINSINNFSNSNEEVKEEEKIRYQTEQEFNLFLECLDDVLWKAFFSFTFWEGTREGEEQALLWKDINFNEWNVTITKTLSTKVHNGGYKITNTKNRKNRTIPIAPKARKYLLDLYNFYSSMKGFNEEWFVFGGIRFLPMSNVRRKLKKTYDILENKLKNHGSNINRLTHHEFGRHSCASYLRNNGAEKEDVAEFLGDTVDVIEKTYYHSYRNEKLEHIKKIW